MGRKLPVEPRPTREFQNAEPYRLKSEEIDMLKKLTKAGAYVQAPRKTFVLLHPWKTVKLGAAFLVGWWLFSGLWKEESEG